MLTRSGAIRWVFFFLCCVLCSYVVTVRFFPKICAVECDYWRHTVSSFAYFCSVPSPFFCALFGCCLLYCFWRGITWRCFLFFFLQILFLFISCSFSFLFPLSAHRLAFCKHYPHSFFKVVRRCSHIRHNLHQALTLLHSWSPCSFFFVVVVAVCLFVYFRFQKSIR